MDFVIDTVGEKTKDCSDDLLSKSIFSDDTKWFNATALTLLTNTKTKQADVSKDNKQTNSRKKELETILKKSVITPDFESLHSVPPYEASQKKLRKERQKEREKTKGKKWYGLPATEVTEEIKNDLEVLQMRSVLDPKHFYKKNDLKVLPKYFQIGKVMDSPLDFYSGRLTNKQRKRTLVEELLADAEFNKYNKRKYREIIQERQKTDYNEWRKGKKKRNRNRK